MDKKQQSKIKKIIQDLCLFYGQKAQISFSLAEDFDESVTEINITVPDAAALLGSDGSNLLALQHLLRVIWYRQEQGAATRFLLDVNNYRSERREYLRELALDTANSGINSSSTP